MTLAVLKLPSFGMAAPGAQSAVAREALDQAFADGLAEGMARQQDDQVRTLTAALDRLARAVAEDDARRADLRHEAVAALTPVLTQILDCLAPAAASRRLESALADELLRLSRMAQPLRARIACGPGLRDMVERCLGVAGTAGIEVVETETETISLSLAGGRIDIDPARVAADIRALIAEINGNETSWTL